VTGCAIRSESSYYFIIVGFVCQMFRFSNICCALLGSGGEAVEIMEKFSERIDELNCRDDVKILLKKCLFRMVAAESVESEISFLSEMRLVLDTPSSEEEELF